MLAIFSVMIEVQRGFENSYKSHVSLYRITFLLAFHFLPEIGALIQKQTRYSAQWTFATSSVINVNFKTSTQIYLANAAA